MTLFSLRSLAFLFILFGLCVVGEFVYAGVSLSINPIEGGSGIRFDKVRQEALNRPQQIRVRVSSTNVKQYQVYQRVREPITNEKGQSLNLSAIEVVSLANSNTSGTLYLQNVDHLSHSDQLIYTSGRGGESDSFTIAYNALPDLINGNGNFRGKIVFTVRTLGGEQTESLVDFFLENESQLKASAVGSRDRNSIRIKDTDQSKAEFVRFSFSGNGSQEINIYQELVSMLSNETGKELPLDVLKMSLQSNSGSNIRVGNGSPLSRSRTLVYSGAIDADEFGLYFLVDSEKVKQIDAGIYKGQFKYTIEAGSNRQEVIINVEYEVPPIFTIDITLPPEGMLFGHIVQSSPAQERQVLVTVNTNLHKPYQVSQVMPSLMTNEKGNAFDKKYFTFKVNLSKDQKGHTKFVEDSAVEPGEYPIYSSDAQGSPITFLVNYQLRGYFDMSPGNFVAPIKYSLNQN
jgi:hypothetical protein